MKVFLVTDMEGISGCVNGGYGQRTIGPIVMDQYLSLMMGEINAVVEGCCRAGASEILVWESHPIDLAKLHPEAKLIRGIPMQYALKLRDFDAMLFVGQHSRGNLADGVRAHTSSSCSIIEIRINDEPVGELAIAGSLGGELGIPVIFLSGDTKACEEAIKLINGPVVTVPVMEGFSVNGGICLSPKKSQALLTEEVQKAFSNIKSIKPIKFKTPVTFTTEFKFAKIADDYCLIPGTKRVDARTVSYTADDYYSAYFGGHALLGIVNYKYEVYLP